MAGESVPVEKINIIEAVKKQIPRKPINVKKDGKSVCRATCPRCLYCFPDIGGAMESYGEVEQYDYCPECGQRIDWR